MPEMIRDCEVASFQAHGYTLMKSCRSFNSISAGVFTLAGKLQVTASTFRYRADKLAQNYQIMIFPIADKPCILFYNFPTLCDISLLMLFWYMFLIRLHASCMPVC